MLALLPSLGSRSRKRSSNKGGLIGLVSLIVFAESGLLIGFFLPGDSLLFITGSPHVRSPRGSRTSGSRCAVVLFGDCSLAAVVG